VSQLLGTEFVSKLALKTWLAIPTGDRDFTEFSPNQTPRDGLNHQSASEIDPANPSLAESAFPAQPTSFVRGSDLALCHECNLASSHTLVSRAKI
jgi:hypothetical protein